MQTSNLKPQLVQTKIVKGQLKELMFNKFDESPESKIVSFDFKVFDEKDQEIAFVTVFPTFDYIDFSTIPQFIVDEEKYIVELECLVRFNKLYLYDDAFWKCVRQIDRIKGDLKNERNN